MPWRECGIGNEAVMFKAKHASTVVKERPLKKLKEWQSKATHLTLEISEAFGSSGEPCLSLGPASRRKLPTINPHRRHATFQIIFHQITLGPAWKIKPDPTD